MKDCGVSIQNYEILRENDLVGKSQKNRCYNNFIKIKSKTRHAILYAHNIAVISFFMFISFNERKHAKLRIINNSL